MVAMRNWNDDERKAKQLAQEIDSIQLFHLKQEALSRVPSDLRNRVETYLQQIYHQRQQQFEINKEAARISQLNNIHLRRDALMEVPIEIRSAVEIRAREFFKKKEV